jgi:hypothetical protein
MLLGDRPIHPLGVWGMVIKLMSAKASNPLDLLESRNWGLNPKSRSGGKPARCDPDPVAGKYRGGGGPWVVAERDQTAGRIP